MIRLYRQTPEGIERTTQVDAAEQHLDSVFWIDLLTPEPAEIKFVERLCGLEMPTYDEMREIEATSRLYTEDGARFMTTTVLSRVDTESPSLSEITFVLMGAKIITIRHSDSYSFRVFSHQLLRQKQISRDQVFTGLLEDHSHAFPDAGDGFGGHGNVPYPYLAGRGGQQAVEVEQQRGFPCAVSAYDGDGFPVGDAQGNAVQRRRGIRVAETQVNSFYKVVAHGMRLRAYWPASMVMLKQRNRMTRMQKRRPPAAPRPVMTQRELTNSGSSPPLHRTAW